jgi:nucleoside-diphosphate-sugar epimerase
MNRILLTGATGFLGKHVLNKFNAQQVLTLGRSPKNDIVCDLGRQIPELPQDILSVVHCAGLAHETGVQSSDLEYQKSHEQGMLHLLQALERTSVQKMIFISTVAVYGLERGTGVDESAALNPQTAYGRYKLAAENILVNWAQARSISYCILRPPLIFGEQPPGNLGHLIRAIQKNRYLFIQGISPQKSVVDVNELAVFICRHLTVMQPQQNGVFNVTDGNSPDLHTLSHYLIQKYNPRFIQITLPKWLIQASARLGDWIPGFSLTTNRLQKLSEPLTFTDQKARQQIGWSGTSVLK